MIGHRVVLRPRNLLETGDLAFAFVRAHLRDVLRLLPFTLVPAAMAFALQLYWKPGAFLAWVMLFALTGLGGGVFVVLFGDLMLQPAADLASVRRRFVRGLPAFVVARLASWLVGCFVFTYGYAAFVPECTLLEQGALGAAMSRSSALMRAAPGRAIGFGIVAIFLLISGAAAGELARYHLRELFGLSTTPIHLFADGFGWASALGLALVTPYVAMLRFLLYIDCRTRREGWDLQVQMNALVQVGENRTLGATRSQEAA